MDSAPHKPFIQGQVNPLPEICDLFSNVTNAANA
jgi:hypothetical protein